jgi:pSer/pThr/pTyr-binding forkhead associated (FHA) protein
VNALEPRPLAPDEPGDAVAVAQVPGSGPDTTIAVPAIKPDVPPVTTGLSAYHQSAVADLPAGSALLVVQQGPTSGARYLLAADRVTAGRHPTSDIFLDDVTVSRKHTEFIRRGGMFVVHDVGALNGTYVGRDRIDEAVLHNGDEVRIGKFRLVFYASQCGATTGPGT